MTLVMGIGVPELLILFVLVLALPALAIYVVYRVVRSATRRGTLDALRAAEAGSRTDPADRRTDGFPG